MGIKSDDPPFPHVPRRRLQGIRHRPEQPADAVITGLFIELQRTHSLEEQRHVFTRMIYWLLKLPQPPSRYRE